MNLFPARRRAMGVLALLTAIFVVFVPASAQAARHHRHPALYVTGDSISVGVGTVDPALDSFPARASQITHRQISTIGYGGRCLVATTCANVARVPLVKGFRSEVLNTIPKPTLVFVEIGVNDLNHVTDHQMEHAYQTLIRQGRRAHVTVVIATITPQGDGLPWPRVWTDAQRSRINNWIRHLKTPHIDFARALGGRVMNPAYNSGDGLHPNAAGAQVMGRVVARFLNGRRHG